MSEITSSRAIGYLALALGVAGITGCGGLSSRASGTLPRTGSVISATSLQLTPSLAIPLEKVVFWGAYASAAYMILDPLAPNWEIEEAAFPNQHVHLALKMKRFYAGGAGEARAVFNRRARDLAQYGGFDGYEVLEYSESLDSSVLGSQRVSQGVIRLSGKAQESSFQGNPAPARITSDNATNPRS